jgi:hypothetical protein
MIPTEACDAPEHKRRPPAAELRPDPGAAALEITER